MRQLREDFFSDDNQMRRSELGDEFSAVKSRLMEDLMSSRPGYYASHGQHLIKDHQKGDRGEQYNYYHDDDLNECLVYLSTAKIGLIGSQKQSRRIRR